MRVQREKIKSLTFKKDNVKDKIQMQKSFIKELEEQGKSNIEEKNGKININMDDDVIRGSTVVLNGKITFPPPPPKVQAIAKHESKNTSKTQEEIEKEEILKQKKAGFQQLVLLLSLIHI